MSSMALPRDLIETDWFRTIATYNPVSYMIEGIRSLLITGWDPEALALGFGCAIVILVAALSAATASIKVEDGENVIRRYFSVAGGLARRLLDNFISSPALFIPPLLMPLFFFIAFAGGLSAITEAPGFDYPGGYTAFEFGFVLLQAAAFGGVFTGFSIAADFQFGFGRRLLLATPNRSALILGYWIVAVVRAAITLALITAIGLAAGMDVLAAAASTWSRCTGWPSLVNIAGTLFSAGIALRFRSLQATPLMMVPTFLFLFLAPVYVPRDLLAGWVGFVSDYDPATHIMETGRELLAGQPADFLRRARDRARHGRAARPLRGPRASQGRGGGLARSRPLGDPAVGPPLCAVRDQTPEPASVPGDRAIGALREPRRPGAQGGERPAAGQQPEQGWERRSGGAKLAPPDRPGARSPSSPPRAFPRGTGPPRRSRSAPAGGPGVGPRRGPSTAPNGRSRSPRRRESSRSSPGSVPVVATATIWEEIVDALNELNGAHPGHRAVHAKGTFCTGTFTATPEAAKFSRAAHLQGDPVNTTIRFSNASGNPNTSDANPIAGRGMAVKFHLPDSEATDIVAVPLVVFTSRTPEDFLEFTRTRIPDPESDQPDPEKLGAFLAEHPETGVALQKGLPKIAPTTSFATSDYRGLHAFCLIDSEGGEHWGRYTWEPEAGVEYLTDEARETASRDYLQEEIRARLAEDIARFTLEFTLAADGDPLDDPTAEWEGEREVVELGELEVTQAIEDPETPEQPVVFDPMHLTDGIEPSDDPILAARPKAYSVSIERRCAI